MCRNARRYALLFVPLLLITASSRASALIMTFTDRASWEAAADTFTEETFDSFGTDQSFNNGASVDVGDFTLTGFGDASADDLGVFNFIDAAPFDSFRPSPNGTTDLAVRVVDENFVDPSGTFPPGPVGFDIVFDQPQQAWGADFGTVASSFRVNAGGVEIGPATDGFFGFIDTTGTFSTIRIDTPPDFGGATTTMDSFVYAETVPEPGAATLLGLGAIGLVARLKKRNG